MNNKAVSIDNINFIGCTKSSIQLKDVKSDDENCIIDSKKCLLKTESDDESQNIIPWRAQLRKTNSKLSLIG